MLTTGATVLAVAMAAQSAAAAGPGSGGVLLGERSVVRSVGRMVDVSPKEGQLQHAVAGARPGDTIVLHKGTYDGQIIISRSGTATAPITLKPFGDGPVTLTATFDTASCDASQPNVHRTIYMPDGVDYWTIEGLNIHNGIWVSGRGFSAAAAWIKDQAKHAKNWKTRRSLPGRGTDDPVAARGIYSALSSVLGTPLDPAEGVEILDNTVTGRGIHVALGRDGEITGNTVTDIDCGIGPGIWVNTYSDFWTVSHNVVARVAASTYRHYMQEGIRFGSASSYNTVEDNHVSDLPGDGRGITTDIDASWNLFTRNTVENTAIALNDQQSGWGNEWSYNRMSSIRGASMVFRGADANLRAPSYNSSSNLTLVKCNVAAKGGTLVIGAMISSAFVDNTFTRVSLGKYVPSYWKKFGNTWNGSSSVPPARPKPPSKGSC
ncbi:exported hypothetical protein [Nostocoides japonicum T1-X7]|uniref:Uncharacterized protein n=1 Tax=Nostocoides japonicum T1-X7 TaxID=1194083 RepID=A0A077LW56_9MICO|nr:right-handed parallel beta-helix repeat-containing protein [Tetrasphaera japonica]CCH78163.1 exported hypothetical protein [Tetrasphaera japonica T1-X7]